MSGYTAEAIGDMLRGQQPDIQLLDRSHLEAMLSGLFSPADLFTGLLDRASYRGEVQVPLTGLLVPDDRSPLPALTISSPAATSRQSSPKRPRASTPKSCCTAPSRRTP